MSAPPVRPASAWTSSKTVEPVEGCLTCSESERERLYREVYESDYWKQEIAPIVAEMLDRERTVVKRLTPTPKSVLR